MQKRLSTDQLKGFVEVLVRQAGRKAKQEHLIITTMKKGLPIVILLVCLGPLHIIGSSVSAHEILSRARSALSTIHEEKFVALHFLANEPTFQFSNPNFTVDESANFATITVTRSGDSSVAASVDYSSTDGTAQQRTDYILVTNTLSFAAGETTKSFAVSIVDDLYPETNETVNFRLTNPSSGSLLGSPNTATLTIQDNDSNPILRNPLDGRNAAFFVRQHYLDFLSREPDQGGLDYWAGQITNCGTDLLCVRRKRLDVSNAFFYELEFQQTGAYVYRLYRAAYGNDQPFPNPDPGDRTEAKKIPLYDVFVIDRARVIAGTNQAQAQLDLANAFVRRPEFLAKYPASLGGPEFVDAMLARIRTDSGADLSSQRNALINLFNQGGRGAVLYRLSDDNAQTNPINNRPFIDAEYNRSFVYTQYAGYLRRDSDIGGFLFWLGKVNEFPVRDAEIQHAMVCAFITSSEYQQRFSSVAIHQNYECGAPRPFADLTAAQRVAALDRANAQFQALSANPNPDQVNQELLNYLRSQPEFSIAGISNDSCVWARYTDGVQVIFINNRPAPPPGSAPSVVQSPSSKRRPENLPDSIKARLEFSLGPLYHNDQATIRTWLDEQNYTQPINSGSTVEALSNVGGDGVFVIAAHGGIASEVGPYVVGTSTLVSEATDQVYEADLRAGRLFHACVAYAAGPPGQPPIKVTTYAITSAFVSAHWHFAPNSFVFLDACSSASDEAADFRAAIEENGGSVVAGWDSLITDTPDMNSVRFVFDRLLGANHVYPESGFKQRPFDYSSVLQDCPNHGVCTDPTTGGALAFFQLATNGSPGFQTLAPSIQDMAVDEATNTLAISGEFGEDPGPSSRAVFVGGTQVVVLLWTSKVIQTDIPTSGAGEAGEVIVTVHQQKSNTAYLTEWQGQFTHVVTAGGTLRQTANFNVRFRADIRKVRYHIHETPSVVDILRILGATQDSLYDYQCIGAYTVGSVTETWSGAGTRPRLMFPPGGSGAFLFSGWVTNDRLLNVVPNISSNGRIVTVTTPDSTGTTNENLLGPPVSIANPLHLTLDANGNILAGSVSATDLSGNHHTLSWSQINAMFAPSPDSPR